MRCRFKADPKFTFAIRPDAPKPNCQNPKWRRANAASTTPAISRFTALFADMAKGLSVILRDIESTKTATEHNTTTNGGI